MKQFLYVVKSHHVFIFYVIYRWLVNVVRVAIFFHAMPSFRHKKSIASNARVSGLRNIQMRGGFDFGDFLWLEAITDYRGVHYNPRVDIGDGFSAGNFFHLGCSGTITIGKNVLVGSKVHITDHSHGLYSGAAQSTPYSAPVDRPLPGNGFVIVGDNVWIGDNVVVLPNVHIGSGSIIGANSVVSRDIPECVIAVGAPARVIKVWDDSRGEWLSVPSS